MPITPAALEIQTKWPWLALIMAGRKALQVWKINTLCQYFIHLLFYLLSKYLINLQIHLRNVLNPVAVQNSRWYQVVTLKNLNIYYVLK